MIKRVLFVPLAMWMVGQPIPAAAQGSTKELLNRAQSEADKRAVEDLVEKLKSRTAPQPAPAPPATAATAPTPAQDPAAPAPVPPPLPSVALPPVKSQPDTPSPDAQRPSAGAAPSTTETPQRPPVVTQEAPTPPVPPVARVPVPQPDSATPVQPDAPPAARLSAANAPETAERLDLPRVDIEVFFALDSADISPVSVGRLAQLGQALTDPRLRGAKFVIAGHTDAFGPADYNLTLSHRRAEAVRRFLVERFNLEPDRLVARGYGAQAPKVRKNPFSPENRRVQIINWSVPASSEQR